MIAYNAFLERRSQRLRRWTVTSLAVAAIHCGGGALALYSWPKEETNTEATGAFLVELAPVQAAPKMEKLDLAIGPRSEESAPTVTPTEEILEKSEIETLDLDPAPLAPDPEVVLPEPQPVEEIDEVEAEEQPQPEVLAEASSSTASPLTAAPPPVDGPEAEKAVASRAGDSDKPSQAELNWHKSLVRHVNRHKKYPRSARRNGEEGVASVTFVLDRSGKVLSAELIGSSGSTELDDEAVAVLERASPFPAPPAEVASVSISLRLPIKFQIKR